MNQFNQVVERTANIAETTSLSILEQHRETEQVATAVYQLSNAAQEIASNGTQAANAAEKAEKEASSGKLVVAESRQSIESLAKQVIESVSVIQKLAADSENVGQVLGVIQGIAEQTNLLALNAAIELLKIYKWVQRMLKKPCLQVRSRQKKILNMLLWQREHLIISLK